MKKLSILLISALLVTVMSLTAFAADGGITYEGGAEEFIFTPGSKYSPTGLFGNCFKDVMPGDVLTETIEVKNAKKGVKAKVYIRFLGEEVKDNTTENFLSQMTLTVTHGSDTLFKDTADKPAAPSEWLYLGEYAPGQSDVLDIQLNVPIEMNTDFREAIGYLAWQFGVEEIPIEEPKTGDSANTALWIILMAVCAAVIGVLAFVRKKQRQ